jgi:putative tricarboxylic transport membrane protein
MQGDQNNGRAGLWTGLVLLAVSVVMAVSTSQMRIPPTYAKVGPQIFPYLAAAALGATGIFFIFQTVSKGRERLEPDTTHTDWRALLAISFGFVFQILFIELLGFVLSSTVLFFAVAFGFGSRRYTRDILTALILSSVAYYVFTRLLNLQLPAGILKGIF